jgi:hypothetical protein
MREIEIFGIPALFTERAAEPDELLSRIYGLHCYVLVSDEDDETILGTILTPVPVELPESGERDVYADDLIVDVEGKTLTPESFTEKYLSPDYDARTHEERYGKTD